MLRESYSKELIMKTTVVRQLAFSLVITLLASTVDTGRVTVAAESANPSEAARHCVRLRKPASDWLGGLPLANGISAVMVWGQPSKTVLSLNHVDFWRDHVGQQTGDFKSMIREMQRLMLAGKADKANEVFFKASQSLKVMPRQLKPGFYVGMDFCGYTNSFEPIGDLVLELDGQSADTDYQRSLDLRHGIAEVVYKRNGDEVRQEYYVSAAADVLVVHLTAGKPLTGQVSFARVPQREYQWKASANGDNLSVTGRFDEGVVSTVSATAKVIKGGVDASVAADAAKPVLRFRNVTDMYLLVVVEAGKGKCDPLAACAKKLQALSTASLDTLRAQHCKEHESWFDRTDIMLGKGPRPSVTDSDALLARAVAGQYEDEMAEKVFQMGRYLMMACNRAGRRPANLQGIWNNTIEPVWDCDLHMDMNIEMNHWLVNPTNLDECNLALFRQMESYVEQGKRIAQSFGCRGVMFAGVCGGDDSMPGGGGGFWVGAAPWIAQHFWTHYEFTLDRDFLANHAYPLLKQIGLFYRDFLVKNKDGKYVTAAGYSPENTPANGPALNFHSTMDTALVREVMRHLLAAGKILDVDQDLWPVWQDLHDNILPFPISKEGVLKEWPAPLEDNPAHRHFSHIYPLFPGDEFTREATPELFAAARGAVYRREAQGRHENFGWSYPYLSCFYARLGEGDNALNNLCYLAKSVTCDNLLTVANDRHKQRLTVDWGLPHLFQIEAGLGASAAIAEMLLQSHQGCIRLLPALPAKWSTGRFHGLKARGAFVIDATWENGSVREVSVESLKGSPCDLQCCTPWKLVKVTNAAGNVPVEFKVDPKSKVIHFSTQSGGQYQLHFQ
jgi:alpha-L-fucosidase 2